jgi:hypothetical protein
MLLCALFVWLISHQPAVLFSQNKSAISNQPTVIPSQNKPAPAISHQPTEQAVAFFGLLYCRPAVWTDRLVRTTIHIRIKSIASINACKATYKRLFKLRHHLARLLPTLVLFIWGAFARVAVTSLACPRGPGHTWPVSSGAIRHVCLHVLREPGQNEFVFVQHHPAGPKHQSTG